MYFSPTKVLKLFSLQEKPQFSKALLLKAIENSEIPNFPASSRQRRKSWDLSQLPQIGEKFGFIKKPPSSKVISVFVTKGGVLKSTISLNLARTAALHNIRTCVVGLDMQSDITTALGLNDDDDQVDFESALKKFDDRLGLPDLFLDKCTIDEILQPTDLPTLFCIPETPELVSMERALSLKNNREHWFNIKVIAPLKDQFDLIIIDASPNWNLLTTNALVSTDLLLSPLECKINNFRNFKMFHSFVTEFRQEMNLSFKHCYLPTRLNMQRKLSRDIFEWYRANIENCLSIPVKESSVGEEAMAMNCSFTEFAPATDSATSMNRIIKSVFEKLENRSDRKIIDTFDASFESTSSKEKESHGYQS